MRSEKKTPNVVIFSKLFKKSGFNLLEFPSGIISSVYNLPLQWFPELMGVRIGHCKTNKDASL